MSTSNNTRIIEVFFMNKNGTIKHKQLFKICDRTTIKKFITALFYGAMGYIPPGFNFYDIDHNLINFELYRDLLVKDMNIPNIIHVI